MFARALLLLSTRSIAWRYGIAIAAAVGAVAAQAWLPLAFSREFPLLLLGIAVVVSAFVGGAGPGLLATLLCAVGAAALFLEPSGALTVTQGTDQLRLLVFIVLGCLISLLTGALHRSHHRIDSILSNITDCYFALDRDWRIAEMNDRAAAYFHRPQAQMVGRVFWDVLPQCLGSDLDRGVRQALRQNAPLHFETRSCVRTDEWAEYHIHPFGRHIHCYFRDITHRRRAEELLRRNEAQLRSILDNAPAAVYMKDPDGRYLLANRRIEDILQRPRQQIEGRTDHDIFPPDTAEALTANDRQVLQAAAPIEFEEIVQHEDGPHTYMAVKFPLADDGHVYALCGISADITPRKRMEESLRRRERQLAVLSQTSQRINAVLEVPVILRTLVASGMELVEATAGTGGLVVEGRIHFSEYNEHGGIRPGDQWFAPGQGVPGHVLQTRQPYLSNDAEHDPYVIPEVRRQLGFQSLINVPILSPDGQVLGCFEMHNKRDRRPFDTDDVAMLQGLAASAAIALENARAMDDLRRAEEAMRLSEERLRLATESADIGTWDFDAVQNTVTWSPRAKEIFGVPPDATVSYDLFLASVHPQDRDAAIRAADSALNPLGTGEYRGEFRIIRRHDSAVRWVTGRGRAFFAQAPDGTRHPIRLIGTTLDITDRKHSEEVLVKAKQQAEVANQAKDQFLATLSHELRTPLMPVLATASSLEDDRRLAPDVRENLAMIHRNVDLEARLIDDLLDLTRIARGKLELEHALVDLHGAILDAVRMSSDDAALNKRLDILTRTDAQEHHAWADPARLRQVLWNLVKNAVKFTPPGGRITIRTSNPAPHRIRVEVSDTGIGIEPDALDRIFNAFQQEDRAVGRRFGGLGLGLAICKAIVELHGGSIRADSPGRGKGSTFTVELPTSAVPAPTGATPPPSPQPTAAPPASPPTGGKLRILLVEDHPDTARVMAQLLTRQGYDVQTAGDVSTALDLARHHPVDVVVSDLGLPDGSGLDLMRQIRALDQRIKGIALSGYGMADDIHASRDAGFAEHLIKPVDIHRLRSAIDHVLVS